MKKTKKILSILLSCLMLMSLLSVGVFAAEGTQDNPIDAKDKWFGYGVDCYLLNPTIAEGNTDGLWYTLTAEKDGILFLEHKYKDVDYTIHVSVNGIDYIGGSVDGEIYNSPIVTAPVKIGDEAIIQIVTKDAAAGTVYANMNVVSGDSDNSIKVKSAGITVYVGAGQTVYFQDDTLNAVYATKGLLVMGDVADATFYTVSKNSESGAVVKKAVVDSDADGVIEAKLGGSLGSAGAPPVKPGWAIENASDKDLAFDLVIVDDAHECVYDNYADTVCDTCGQESMVKVPLVLGGASVSEDKNGLALRFDVTTKGMAMEANHKAIYDNATVGDMKLVSMGAVVCNNYEKTGVLPTLDDIDGINVIDVPAVYLYALDEEANITSYAIRIIDIPDDQKDTFIYYVPYIVVEDAAGVQHTLYGNACYATYNGVANA